MAQMVEKVAWVDPSKVGRRLDPGIASVESVRPAYRPTVEGTVVAVNLETKPEIPTNIPPTSQQKPEGTVPGSRQPSSSFLSPLVGIIGVIFVGIVLWWVFSPITQLAHIKGSNWGRELKLQQYQEVYTEDWILPTNARFINSENRVYGYQDLITGYKTVCTDRTEAKEYSEYSHTETECYTDGSCKDKDIYTQRTEYETVQDCKDEPIIIQDPIYQLWYHFYIWKWVDIPSLVTSGNGGEPYWPHFDANQYFQVTNRIETHTILFDDGTGVVWPYKCGIEEYRSLSNQIGRLFLITTRFGAITSIQRK